MHKIKSILLSTGVVLSVMAAAAMPADAGIAAASSASDVYPGIYIGCDNHGGLTSYRGVGTGLPGDTSTNIYFTLYPQGGPGTDGARTTLVTSRDGSVVTGTYYPVAGEFRGARVMYVPVTGGTYSSPVQYCLAGC